MWESSEYGGTASQASEVSKETEDMHALAAEDRSLQRIMHAPKCVQDGSTTVAKKLEEQMRNFHPKIEAKIKAEVETLLATGFIKPIKHIVWLANIVPVKKKNIVQIQICINY
ncbi:hypothetical protein ACFX12_000261 [Malus domestica]